MARGPAQPPLDHVAKHDTPMLTRRCLLSATATGSTMLLAPGARAELDPGTRDFLVYTLVQNSATVGYVLATRTDGGGYAANCEYWFMTANVSSWSAPPSGLGTLSFVMASSTSWTRGTQSGNFHAYAPGEPEYIGLEWAMVESAG